MKLRKILQLQEVSSKEEHMACWHFNQLITKELSKIVKAHESVMYNIKILRDNYREKAMIICGQINPENGQPWMRAVQPKIISGKSVEKLEEFESNSYFQAQLTKEAKIKEKWVQISDLSKKLMDLYMYAPKQHHFVEGFHI